jgi:hypothetical protein
MGSLVSLQAMICRRVAGNGPLRRDGIFRAAHRSQKTGRRRAKTARYTASLVPTINVEPLFACVNHSISLYDEGLGRVSILPAQRRENSRFGFLDFWIFFKSQKTSSAQASSVYDCAQFRLSDLYPQVATERSEIQSIRATKTSTM